MRCFGLLATAMIAMGAAGAAAADDISWSAPVNETGRASDVATGGILATAVTAGKVAIVGGVRFAPMTSFGQNLSTFGAAPVSISDASTGYQQYGSAPGGWDVGYRALTAGGIYAQHDAKMTIHLGALKPGHRYLVQIFEPFWNSNWATAYSDGQNQSRPLNLSGPAVTSAVASQTPQAVTGTFMASSDTQDISVSSQTDYLVFAALQLRDLGPPPAKP